MAQVKVSLDQMTIPAKIQFARQRVVDLTGNPNFPTPTPALAAVTTAAAGLETAFNVAQSARAASLLKTTLQDTADGVLDTLITQLANCVQTVSNGDKAKIESSGFAVRNSRTPPGPLTPPTDLQVLPGDAAGTADLSWATVRGAYSYSIERAADAPVLQWATVGAATRLKATVNSMVSGQKYWFRIAAVGPLGPGPVSSPVPLFAP